MRHLLPPLLTTALVLLLAGCGASHRLHRYDFSGRTVAVVAAIPPRPEVFSHTGVRIDLDAPVATSLRVGAAIWKEREARKAQARLDRAFERVDVAEQIARQTLLRGANVLRYHPVNDPDAADFILDLRVFDYALVADSWDAAVRFELEGELVLVDRRSGKPVWQQRTQINVPVSEAAPLGATFGNVFTAATLSGLSEAEMVEALEALAGYTADHLSRELRHDYYASRR
jgi:hypothetical protein